MDELEARRTVRQLVEALKAYHDADHAKFTGGDYFALTVPKGTKEAAAEAMDRAERLTGPRPQSMADYFLPPPKGRTR